MRVYTIGHGERKLEDFLDLVCRHGITHVVDVRPSHKLNFLVEYEPENVKVDLLVRGIMYANMSSSLGNVSGTTLEEMRRCQEDEVYRAGIQKLVQVAMATDRVVCLLGMDAYAERCHRAKLIGETLSKLRFDVQHIEDDIAVPQPVVMRRLVEQSFLEI
jgi:uncharacterized protein (DUF488 family)